MNPTDYPIVLVPLCEEDGGGFAAYVPDLPGCMSDGETPEEAANNVQDAIACWFEAATDMEREIPEPGASIEKARQRDKAMIEALKAALDYADHADGRIQKLERKISELALLMDNGNGYRNQMMASIISDSATTKHVH